MKLLLALGLLALVPPMRAHAQECPADSSSHVRADKLCLALTAWGAEQPSQSPVLIVWLHGDTTRGGPADYNYASAQRYAGPGVVSIAMLRPEYFDAKGNKSSGQNYLRSDSYTEENVDAVAAGVRALRTRYNARKVVLVGHSGGAAIAGVILGKHPGTADAALLVSCPCDIPVWRTGRSAWARSLSPHRYVEGVPAAAQIAAITGSEDTNTRPQLARDYVVSLTRRGVRAEMREVPGASHDWNARLTGPEFDAALKALLE